MTVGSTPPSYGKRRRPAVSRLGLLLLIGLCVLFVSSYTSRLLRKAEVEREIVEWERRIAEAELRQQELQVELDYVNSPAYIEDVARNQLDMAREGDKVIIVVPGEPDMDTATVTEDAGFEGSPADDAIHDGPNWAQWLELLSGED